MPIMRMLLLGSVVGASATMGCAAKRSNPMPAASAPCAMVISDSAARKPVAERTLSASQWFSLLLHGYQPSGEIPRPAQDCSGRRLDWFAERCLPGAQATPLPVHGLTAANLVVKVLDDETRLVWAQVESFSDGQAQGAVARARFDAEGVNVQELGVLRAFPTNANLHIEKTAGGSLLVAEGELCTIPENPSSCSRTARLVPLVKNQFLPADLSSDATGRCIGPALLLLKGQGARGHGSERKDYQFESSLTFSAEGVTVHEQLSVEEKSKDGTSGTFLRRVQGERRISLHGSTLLVTGPSILDLWLSAHPQSR